MNTERLLKLAHPRDSSAARLGDVAIYSSGPLAEEVRANAEVVYCYVPTAIDPLTLTKYSMGRSAHSTVERLVTDDDLLVELVTEYLQNSNRFAMFENELARVGDPVLLRAKSRVCFYRDRVIHWIVNPASADEVRRILVESRTTPDWFALCGELALPASDTPDPDRCLTRSDLQRIARAARFALSGISDGESFLLCELVAKASPTADGSFHCT